MNWKIKLAYRALRIQDAADAVASKVPRWILEMGVLMMGWLLIGGSPMACLWAFAIMAMALTCVFAVIVMCMIAIHILGCEEKELERWALA